MTNVFLDEEQPAQGDEPRNVFLDEQTAEQPQVPPAAGRQNVFLDEASRPAVPPAEDEAERERFIEDRHNRESVMKEQLQYVIDNSKDDKERQQAEKWQRFLGANNILDKDDDWVKRSEARVGSLHKKVADRRGHLAKFRDALVRGYESTAIMAAQAWLGITDGDNPETQKTMRNLQSVGREWDASRPKAAGSVSDIKSAGDVLDFIGEAIGENLYRGAIGTTAAIASGGTATMLGAGAVGASAAAIGGSSLSTLALNTGEAVQDQLDEGVPFSRGWALAQGAGYSVLDGALGVEAGIGKLAVKTGLRAAKDTAVAGLKEVGKMATKKGALKTLAKGVAGEALQEPAQSQIVGRGRRWAQTGSPLRKGETVGEAWMEALDEAAGGAAAALGMGGGGAAISHANARRIVGIHNRVVNAVKQDAAFNELPAEQQLLVARRLMNDCLLETSGVLSDEQKADLRTISEDIDAELGRKDADTATKAANAVLRGFDLVYAKDDFNEAVKEAKESGEFAGRVDWNAMRDSAQDIGEVPGGYRGTRYTDPVTGQSIVRRSDKDGHIVDFIVENRRGLKDSLTGDALHTKSLKKALEACADLDIYNQYRAKKSEAKRQVIKEMFSRMYGERGANLVIADSVASMQDPEMRDKIARAGANAAYDAKNNTVYVLADRMRNLGQLYTDLAHERSHLDIAEHILGRSLEGGATDEEMERLEAGRKERFAETGRGDAESGEEAVAEHASVEQVLKAIRDSSLSLPGAVADYVRQRISKDTGIAASLVSDEDVRSELKFLSDGGYLGKSAETRGSVEEDTEADAVAETQAKSATDAAAMTKAEKQRKQAEREAVAAKARGKAERKAAGEEAARVIAQDGGEESAPPIGAAKEKRTDRGAAMESALDAAGEEIGRGREKAAEAREAEDAEKKRLAQEEAARKERVKDRKGDVEAALDEAGAEIGDMAEKRRVVRERAEGVAEQNRREAEERNEAERDAEEAAALAEEERWRPAREAAAQREQDAYDQMMLEFEESRSTKSAKNEGKTTNEAGNGADEAQSQPEEGAVGRQEGEEVAQPGAEEPPRAEAADARVVEPQKADGGSRNLTPVKPVEKEVAKPLQAKDKDDFDLADLIGNPDALGNVSDAENREMKKVVVNEMLKPIRDRYAAFRKKVMEDQDFYPGITADAARRNESFDGFLQELRAEISKHKAIIDDWKSRAYKQSNKVVDVASRDEQGETDRVSTNAINEARRRRVIEQEQRQIDKLEKNIFDALGSDYNNILLKTGERRAQSTENGPATAPKPTEAQNRAEAPAEAPGARSTAETGDDTPAAQNAPEGVSRGAVAMSADDFVAAHSDVDEKGKRWAHRDILTQGEVAPPADAAPKKAKKVKAGEISNGDATHGGSTRFKRGADGLSPEGQRQYDEVVRRYTNPDGTKKRGWMKAPNGQPTKLTERQWVQVRTPAFKEWFGDWEANAVLSAIEELPPIAVTTREGGIDAEAAYAALGEVENALDERKVRFVNSTLGKILRHKGYPTERIVHQLGDIFAKSVPIGFSAEEKREGHKEHRNFVGYHNYVGKISDDSGEYYVRFTVQEERTRSKGYNPNAVHSTFVSDVELYKESDLLASDTANSAGEVGAVASEAGTLSRSTTSVGEREFPRITDGIIANLFSRRNGASKVVDENGEPLVVWHGTLEKGLVKFDPDFIGSRYAYDEKGFFFIDRKSLADDYSTSEFEQSRKGETIPAFLSLKNPLVVNNAWGAENGLGSRVFDDKDAIEFWDNYQSLMLEKSEGRDGVIIDDGTSKMVVAFSPNQIKSATDNNGDFSGSDYIRFKRGSAPAGGQKSADVEYPDAGREISGIRFKVGAKRREEYARQLAKHRPDLDANAVLDEIDKFDEPKKEKVALHWVVRGAIRLPEDAYKVEDALSVAQKAKVDPFAYSSPLALIEAHKDIKPTRRAIDPATVPELSDRRDEGDGIVSYEVADTREGQVAMRRIIDTHWGEDANPWCLLARDKNRRISGRFRGWMIDRYPGQAFTEEQTTQKAEEYERETGNKAFYYPTTEESLAGNAWNYWQRYSALPKRVAFKDGKLLAFMATSGEYLMQDDDPLARRYPERFAEYTDWRETEEAQENGEPSFRDWLDYEGIDVNAEEWWDRKDESHPDLDWARGGEGTRFKRNAAFEHSLDALQSIADGADYGVLHNAKYGEIRYPLGRMGDGGMGFLHIVEHRMNGSATLEEAVDTAIRVGQAAEIGKETANILNTRHFEYDGTRAIVAIQNNNMVVTGYEIDADENAAAIRRAAERNPHPHVGSDEVIGVLRDRIANLRAESKGRTMFNYDPRSNIPAVRGGWSEKKILRYLKANPSLHGVKTAARLISEFDTVDELKDHMFYHGTRNYVGKMQPSMTQSERWAQEHGGGGYGQRYWGISVSKSKKVASNFGNPSPGVSIYPVVLAKGAKVIDRPDLTDAADVEDHIVELWNDGVDAVRLGDWSKDTSEQELLVLNPRAICNIGTADSYRYFRLWSPENPLNIKDDAQIAELYEAASEYADYSPSARFGKPTPPSMFVDGSTELKPKEVYDAERAQYEEELAAWRDSEQGRAAEEYETKMRGTIRFKRTAPVDSPDALFGARASRKAHGLDDLTAEESRLAYTDKELYAAGQRVSKDVPHMMGVVSDALTSDRALSLEDTFALTVFLRDRLDALADVHAKMQSGNAASFAAEEEYLSAIVDKASRAVARNNTKLAGLRVARLGVALDTARDTEAWITEEVKSRRVARGLPAEPSEADAAMIKQHAERLAKLNAENEALRKEIEELRRKATERTGEAAIEQVRKTARRNAPKTLSAERRAKAEKEFGTTLTDDDSAGFAELDGIFGKGAVFKGGSQSAALTPEMTAAFAKLAKGGFDRAEKMVLKQYPQAASAWREFRLRSEGVGAEELAKLAEPIAPRRRATTRILAEAREETKRLLDENADDPREQRKAIGRYLRRYRDALINENPDIPTAELNEKMAAEATALTGTKHDAVAMLAVSAGVDGYDLETRTDIQRRIAKARHALSLFRQGKVNEAARESGILYDDEATALKDMEDTLRKLVKEKADEIDYLSTFSESNAEAVERVKQLKAELDEANDALRLMRKETSLAEKKRKYAEVLEKRLAEAQRRADALRGEIESEAFRERKSAAEAKVTELKAALSAARRSEDALKRIQDRIAEYERRIADEDYDAQVLRYQANDAYLQSKLALARERRNEARRKLEAERRKRSYREKGVVGKALYGLGGLLGEMKGVVASFDLSSVLRQGGQLSWAHPFLAAKNLGETLKAWKSAEYANNLMAQLRMRPNWQYYEKAGIDFTDWGEGATNKEDVFLLNQFRRITSQKFVKAGVEASERAFSMFLNLMRADVFDAMASGSTFGSAANMNDSQLKALGKFINIATQRAAFEKGGKWERAIPALNTILWSPRNVASRFQFLYETARLVSGGAAYGDVTMRSLFAKELVRYIGGMGAAAMFLKAVNELLFREPDDPPDETEFDPRSSDFLKVRFGNVRIDLTSGLTSILVFGTRMVGGETKNVRGQVRKSNRYELVGRFLRQKFAPGASLVYDLGIAREDFEKRDIDWGSAWDKEADRISAYRYLAGSFIPLSGVDLVEQAEVGGVPKTLVTGALSILGANVQAFDPYNFKQLKGDYTYFKGLYDKAMDDEERRNLVRICPMLKRRLGIEVALMRVRELDKMRKDAEKRGQPQPEWLEERIREAKQKAVGVMSGID